MDEPDHWLRGTLDQKSAVQVLNTFPRLSDLFSLEAAAARVARTRVGSRLGRSLGGRVFVLGLGHESIRFPDAPWLIMRMLMRLSAKVRLAAAATPFFSAWLPRRWRRCRGRLPWMESGLSLSWMVKPRMPANALAIG